GRYIVFTSAATNLIANDRNRKTDVFLRDRVMGTTVRVSQTLDGTGFVGDSSQPSISANAAYVAFVSKSSTGLQSVYIWERSTGNTTRISAPLPSGQEDDSFSPSINDDGRFVAFASYCPSLVNNDTNACCDIFVWKRTDGSVTRVSVTTANKQTNNDS